MHYHVIAEDSGMWFVSPSELVDMFFDTSDSGPYGRPEDKELVNRLKKHFYRRASLSRHGNRAGIRRGGRI